MNRLVNYLKPTGYGFENKFLRHFICPIIISLSGLIFYQHYTLYPRGFNDGAESVYTEMSNNFEVRNKKEDIHKPVNKSEKKGEVPEIEIPKEGFKLRRGSLETALLSSN